MSGLTKTGIPYLDAVWNPITGCSPAGDGCRNCYAARLAATRLKHQPKYAGLACETSVFGCQRTYQWTGEVRFHPELLDAPLHARKPRVIGVCFMGDVCHAETTYTQRSQVYDIIDRCPHHRFVVLTKRPEILHDDMVHIIGDGPVIPNLILGTSVWDQASADRNIPHLLATPAACRVVSLEPMLGAVSLDNICTSGERSGTGQADFMNALSLEEWTEAEARAEFGENFLPTLDLVICGPETGPGARPFDPQWAVDVKAQCDAAGVPYYDKRESHAHWRDLPEVMQHD